MRNAARRVLAPLALTAALIMLVIAVSCGSVSEEPDAAGTPDGAENIDAPPAPDAALIDGQPPDAPPMPVTAPAAVAQTAGGGVAESPGYRARLRLGAPQPMGSASSAGYRVSLGNASP